MRNDMTVKIFVVLMGISIGAQSLLQRRFDRAPAAVEKPLELHLQSLSLDPSSRIQKLDKVYLRATFNKEHVVEFGKNEAWSLNSGETRRLDLTVDVQPDWVKKDEFEFKLEVVQQGMFESTLVRCSTISKSVSTYNRAYQCTVPGDSTPLLTYRLAAKGAPEPGAPNLTQSASR